VTVVIGVLAAIALPLFLQEKSKGNDAAAKSDVRNVASLVSACGEEEHDFHNCDTKAELGNPGFNFGTGPGEVDVTAPADDEFEVTGVSVAQSGGANHTFTWSKDSSGKTTRTCVAGPGNNDGGCSGGTW